RQFADRRERGAGVELNWDAPCELAQVELHRLRAARDVRDAQQRLAAIFAQVSKDLAVLWIEEAQAAAPERRVIAPHRERAPRPVEQRVRVTAVRLDVDRRESVERVHVG